MVRILHRIDAAGQRAAIFYRVHFRIVSAFHCPCVARGHCDAIHIKLATALMINDVCPFSSPCQTT